MIMNKLTKIIASVILLNCSYYAQNIGINATGSSPDNSAMLDVDATDKGVLIPRVALTATNVSTPVTSPATSLMVYNSATAGSGTTAVTPGFYHWNGTEWERMISGNNVATTDDQNLTGASLTGTSLQINIENGTSASIDLASLQDGTGTDSQTLSLSGNTLAISGGNNVTLVDNVNDADNVVGNEYNTGISLSGTTLSVTDAGGAQSINLSPLQDQDWYETGGTSPANNINDNIYTQGSVGIGNIGAHSSASLDISSISKGLLIPRMSEIQKNAITSPASGLLIYQLNNKNGFYYYDSVQWLFLGNNSSAGSNSLVFTTDGF